MTANRHWTPAEDRRLVFFWGGGYSLAQLAVRLQRTPCSVYVRARRIGLQVGAPQGWEPVWRAVQRCGFSNVAQLEHVLAWAGVRSRPALGRPNRKATWHRRIVEIAVVDEAVARWAAAEPVSTAARRRGLCDVTLRRRLRRAGIVGPGGGKHLRVTDDQVELAMAGRAA